MTGVQTCALPIYKTDLEAGASDVKTMLWNAMAKERPDLYKQVSGYLDRKVQEGKP